MKELSRKIKIKKKVDVIAVMIIQLGLLPFSLVYFIPNN